MTDDLYILCRDEPQLADSLIAALKSTINFYRTRGQMLRSLTQPSQQSRTVLRYFDLKDFRL